MQIKFVANAAFFSSILFASVAGATPHALPFSYPYATLGEGETEIEMYTDLTPLRVFADPAGDPGLGKLIEPQYALTTEIEYGITDRTELGLYQSFYSSVQNGGDNTLGFDGLKWRIRHRLAEAGEWPVDVSLYLELETMHDELALEEKVNLEKDFGRLALISNLWIEQPLERPWDSSANGQKLVFVVNPTAGFTYQLTPGLHLGVEYWGRGQIVPTGADDQERHNRAVHHFVGPALQVGLGRLWFAVAMYANLTDPHLPQPGDAYGPVWFRSIVGIEL